MGKSRVEGKVVLITGAGSGIGRAIAESLAAEGAIVNVADINVDGAQMTQEAIGGQAEYHHLDVADESSWQETIEDIKQSRGHIDALVNNSGVALVKALGKMTLDEWRRVMAVNLDGVFLGIKHTLPIMATGGSIVNVSSVLGLVGQAGVGAYCASKGGVRLLTKSAALELAPRGIRVNSIHPGYIETPMIGVALAASSNPEAMKAQLTANHPIGFLGEPRDIAQAVVYLASDESRFVTGSEIVVDGGYTAQ
ncbi:MAG: glucose 1-dehydrogenase [Alphaproteobacteria bacterium]|nr:glucose 1-dehydrogenase [Alphaproteobacteria bacterium]